MQRKHNPVRFAFGKNWQLFARHALTAERVNEARSTFQTLFEGIAIKNKSFLDIGFGQGLSLCIAQEMGAHVLGIDSDAENIAALRETARMFPGQAMPDIQIVSILDPAFVRQHHKEFDIVHAWGVLHHTGNMRQAIEHAAALVKTGGYLILAIYNRHWTSPIWRRIKWVYNRSPRLFQHVLIGVAYPVIYGAKWLVTGKNPTHKERGMNFFYNVIDWVGGYPYEYARISDIRNMVGQYGLICVRVIPAPVPTGCNQFIFQKNHSGES